MLPQIRHSNRGEPKLRIPLGQLAYLPPKWENALQERLKRTYCLEEQADRQRLILRGARQAGKTTIVELFSKNFKQIIGLNLELEEDAAPFRDYKNIQQLTER